jgi:hypothetical protein
LWQRSQRLNPEILQHALLVAVFTVGLVALPHAEAQAPIKTLEQRIKVMAPKQYAAHLVQKQWKNHDREYKCLVQLWQKESGWRPHAANPTSTAWGIPQFLNSTWVNYGYPVRPKDPQIQIKAGLRYIYKRYSTPCNAWEFWKKKAGQDMRGGWY